MNNLSYSYPPSPPFQPAVPAVHARRGCLKGCVSLFATGLVLLILLVVVARFVSVPFIAYVNSLPCFFQYAHVVHQGQTDVKTVVWSPNGKYIAAVSDNRTVQVWEVTTNRTLFTYQAPANSSSIPLSWSPNSTYIALADMHYALLVVEATTGHRVFAYAAASSGGNAVAWSPDSRFIAAVNATNRVQVWSLVSAQTIFTLPSAQAGEVARSPDNNYLATTAHDGKVHIWDAGTGQ